MIRNSNPVTKVIGYASRRSRNGNLELENLHILGSVDKTLNLRRRK